MIQKRKLGEWLSTKEAAELAGMHENTIKLHRSRIEHKRIGYGARSPLMFSRRSLEEWLKAYELVRPSNS